MPWMAENPFVTSITYTYCLLNYNILKLFTDVDPTILKAFEFIEKQKLCEFRKNELVIRADDEFPKYCYFIKKGCVKQYAVSNNGEEKTLLLFTTNQHFPIITSTRELPNRFSFEALCPTQAWRIERSALLDHLQKDHHLLMQMTDHFTKRFENTLRVLENHMLSTATTKVLMSLYSYASAMGKPDSKTVTIDLHISHREIASMAGISRETVSREIYKLMKEGMVSKVRGRYVLADFERIKNILTF